MHGCAFTGCSAASGQPRYHQRAAGDRLRHPRARDPRPGVLLRAGTRGPGRRSGHAEHAGHRQGGAGGGRGLPEPAVPHPRRLLDHRVRPAAPAAGQRGRGCGTRGPGRVLPGRCRVLGRRGLHRHDDGDPRQRPGGLGRAWRRGPAGLPHRVPHRRHRGHADRRSGPARRLDRADRLQQPRTDRARGLRLRRRPAGHVHACRRRHLHQGGRRRRRPGRQGRGRHPRGRPAQRRHHRRQRRRQRG